MNRKIKFRIWDKQTKKFISNSASLHCQSDWAIRAFSGEIVDYVAFSSNSDNGHSIEPCSNHNYYTNGDRIVRGKRYILSQFTGLKDRSKKDIYEGDIVSFACDISDNDTETILGEVFFEDGIFYFGREEGFAWNDLNLRKDSVKIIGNMFESAESQPFRVW